MMRKTLIAALFVASVSLMPQPAFAGDAAIIIFRSGQVLVVGDGYRAIVDSMKRLNESSADHRVVELTLGGGEVVLNVAEVVMVCRDRCKGMSIQHQLDPKRGKVSEPGQPAESERSRS